MSAFRNICRGLTLGLLAVSLPLQAATWRVDLIVFRYLRAVEEGGQIPKAPRVAKAIEIDATEQLRKAGITILTDEEFGMRDYWAQLRGSPQFRPLIRLAWTQKDPPAENGPRLHLKSGEPFTVELSEGLGRREFLEVDGTVSLTLGRYLSLDADMIYTLAGPEAASWHLQESRQMRSDELHHLDSPKLGIVAKVSKWLP